MGIRSYVRDRKQVKADRAQEAQYAGSIAAIQNAMGYDTVSRTGGDSFETADKAKDKYAGTYKRGGGHVNVIPAGSKKRTETNSDRYVPGE